MLPLAILHMYNVGFHLIAKAHRKHHCQLWKVNLLLGLAGTVSTVRHSRGTSTAV